MSYTNSLEKHLYECSQRTLTNAFKFLVDPRSNMLCILTPNSWVLSTSSHVATVTFIIQSGPQCICFSSNISKFGPWKIWAYFCKQKVWESGQPVHLPYSLRTSHIFLFYQYRIMPRAQQSKPNSAPSHRAKITAEGWNWMSRREHEGSKALFFWLSLCKGEALSVW